jgi:hypothetical protein
MFIRRTENSFNRSTEQNSTFTTSERFPPFQQSTITNRKKKHGSSKKQSIYSKKDIGEAIIP